MKLYRIDEGLRAALVTVIDEGVFPSISFKVLASLRQSLVMSTELTDDSRTDTTNSKAVS